MTGLLVALDLPSVDQAFQLAAEVRPYVTGYKVGLELLLSPDGNGVERIGELGLPLFVDAKLHDIPATVERAARQLGRRGARWVTVHAAGGKGMLEAGVSGLSSGSDGAAGVLAVTVLTSLDDDDLARIGDGRTVRSEFESLLSIAAQAGVEGVICSVHEVPPVKEHSQLITVTPGIRPGRAPLDDQKRVATPAMAAAIGVDYVVVGRAITAAPNPGEAATLIAAELSSPIAAAPPGSSG